MTSNSAAQPDDVMLSAQLAAELSELDSSQRDAVLRDGNVAVMAGPGAGKTRTLVSRIGWLLTTTSKHRGVAAITYTDAAAREVSVRLSRLGLVGGRRLASHTVHGFCMGHVLPYAALAHRGLPADLQIIEEHETDPLWADALAEAHVPLGKKGVAGERAKLKRLRRQRAVEGNAEIVGGYDAAIINYQARLRAEHKLDFDEIPIVALDILRSSDAVKKLIASRFPNLIVDEYQDLGPVLHAIVKELLTAGVRITAVGDPDQTMYEYEGADPRYLKELADRADFFRTTLNCNYRSGKTLIAAGSGVLGADRGYVPHPSRLDAGVIEIDPVTGDLDQHATRCALAVLKLLNEGTPIEDIAILYPGATDLHTKIMSALTSEGIPFDVERGRRVPNGPVGDFVSACAARHLSGPLPGFDGNAGSSDPHRVANVRVLAQTWNRLRRDAGTESPEDTLRTLTRQMVNIVDGGERLSPADDASPFLDAVRNAIDLPTLTANSKDGRDRSLSARLTSAQGDGLTMAELAGRRAPGRLTLTTYHSSKGREFSAVVLPGLVDGLIPFFFANRPLTQGAMTEARRKFYVAITRAQHRVILIPGSRFTENWGIQNTRVSKWSRFVTDIQSAIGDD